MPLIWAATAVVPTKTRLAKKRRKLCSGALTLPHIGFPTHLPFVAAAHTALISNSTYLLYSTLLSIGARQILAPPAAEAWQG